MRLTIGWMIATIFAIAGPVSAAKPEGKEVFEKVCGECHGERGAGNQLANNFYKVQIPRLDSDYVQNKSDKELKAIIVKGRRNMKPPLAGTPYMQHKVEPSLLNDMVTYIRTLKKS